MTLSDRQALRDQLILHEGVRLRPYVDTTGHQTIGVGHNLDANPISMRAALVILDDDIEIAVRELVGAFPWFVDLDPVRQRALVDLCFNLGLSKLRRFRRFLAAMATGDYGKASAELRDSLWFRQVASRGPRVVHMVEAGEWVA